MVRRGIGRKARWRLATLLGALVVALVASCSSCASPKYRRWLFPPSLPDGVVVVTPTDYYRRLWREVEECSGTTYPMDKITIYAVATDRNGFLYKGTRLAGYGDRENGFILIGTPWVTHDPTVRHEMLHVIASPTGHNPLFFGVYRDTAPDSPPVVVVEGKCTQQIVCATCGTAHDKFPVNVR